jgi:PAS domain S-box-containing protein
MQQVNGLDGAHSQLRERAEQILQQTPESVNSIPGSDIQTLIHELQVHQIELEMQNEELRRAQMELEATRDKYSDLYDFAPVGYFTVSGKGQILEANLTSAGMLGAERASLIGKRFSRFIHREDQDVFYFHRKKLLETKDAQPCELRFVRSDGSDFFVQLDGMIMRADKQDLNQLRVAITDISERKRGEEERKEQSEFLNLVIESLAHPFYVIDSSDYTIKLANSAALVGRLSKESTCYALTHNSDRPCASEEHVCPLEIIKQTREHATVEHVHYDKDGNPRNVEVHAHPIFDRDGNVTQIIEYSLDITDRKRAEQEKVEMEARLQQVQRLESIGTLAGGIAHNFNNLLMAIQGNISLILFDSNSAHPHYKLLRAIESVIKSGARLTAQLLGYAREGAYQPRPINLNRSVEKASIIIRTTRKDIRIHEELADDVFAVEADLSQIDQVVLNLLANTADAMPAGGDLTLKTENITDKDIKTNGYDAKPGKYVQLTVTDTGRGMDNKTMSHLFEPFFTTKGIGSGTGLGLASAYGIVKGHGGYICVESELGHGTMFTVCLPALDKNIEETAEPHPQIRKGTGTVLLVDDEEPVMDVGIELLKALGYSALEARGGREAIELYRDNKDRIDLVLLDMVMPDMGGGKVYDKMKETNPNVKVILLSGYSIESQAKEILARGCNAFIQKPFNLQALSQKIREVLDKE